MPMVETLENHGRLRMMGIITQQELYSRQSG
jgi:hypothetical protein